MSDSGRGGQPGTYTSTGTILIDALDDCVIVEHAAEDAHAPIEITHFGSGIWS